MKSQDALDTSRISITAHYTGYVWYENGLSHRAFASWQGRIGYYGVAPWMAAAKRFLGSDLETILLQRHYIIDHLLHQAIWEKGVTQVVELACGLSPRGVRFMNTYAGRGLRYIETDLPGMVTRKKSVLSKAKWSHNHHQVLHCNMLAESGESSLFQLIEHLDRNQPIALITEGLINYFDLETVQALWKRMTVFFKNFPYGVYLSDNIPSLVSHPDFRYVKQVKKVVELIGQGNLYLHGTHPQEIEPKLLHAGFEQAKVHLPEFYSELLPIPFSKKQSLIHVLEASVQGGGH